MIYTDEELELLAEDFINNCDSCGVDWLNMIEKLKQLMEEDEEEF